MAKNDTFGWDLLYKVTEPQIRNNSDVLICLVHWKLIHQGFRCVGVGEDTSQPDPNEQSELLPEGWNSSNKYTLRYVLNGKLYLLNAIKDENNMIINMNRVVDNHASGTFISVDVVKNIHGPLATLIPNYDELITRVRSDLVDPMFEVVPSKEVQTQTPVELTHPQQSETRRSESYLRTPQRDIQPPPHPLFTPGNPLSVGRSDLDPFAPGGGGMLFEPPGMGPRIPGPGFDPGLPMGSIPPGARFDPFRPPGTGPPRAPQPMNPDHDHMPPPGYDDMFM